MVLGPYIAWTLVKKKNENPLEKAVEWICWNIGGNKIVQLSEILLVETFFQEMSSSFKLFCLFVCTYLWSLVKSGTRPAFFCLFIYLFFLPLFICCENIYFVKVESFWLFFLSFPEIQKLNSSFHCSVNSLDKYLRTCCFKSFCFGQFTLPPSTSVCCILKSLNPPPPLRLEAYKCFCLRGGDVRMYLQLNIGSWYNHQS